MRQEDRLLFKTISILLRFPDEDLINSLSSVRAALEEFPLKAPGGRCHAFIDYLEAHSLVQLQEEFSRIFDFRPETCLNLTYHRYGESSERGSALAGLIGLYRYSGYEILGSELPVYLPLMLEFLSICDEDAGTKIVEEWTDQVEKIAHRLKKNESPYAALLETLWDVFGVSGHPRRQVDHG